MTQPKISAEAYAQAINDAFEDRVIDHAQREALFAIARELTAAQPAAGNEAVRALVTKWRADQSTWRMVFVKCAEELRTALAADQKEKT